MTIKKRWRGFSVLTTWQTNTPCCVLRPLSRVPFRCHCNCQCPHLLWNVHIYCGTDLVWNRYHQKRQTVLSIVYFFARVAGHNSSENGYLLYGDIWCNSVVWTLIYWLYTETRCVIKQRLRTLRSKNFTFYMCITQHDQKMKPRQKSEIDFSSVWSWVNNI